MQSLPDPAATAAAVIVATHNRAHLLPRLVAALEAQAEAPGFEVVIVDDGSTDDTWTVLGHLAARSSVRIHPVRLLRNRGPATARNIGWRTTNAEVLVFTDDDCAPEPAWLHEIVAATTGADIVQGRTEPDPAQAGNLGPFSRTLQIEGENGFYQTCNIAYRRQILELNNGFFEQFRYPAGEDTDLAWRAKNQGASSTFCAAAVVRHDVRPSDLGVAIRDSWRWQSVPLAVSRHPELRTLFSAPFVWRRAHGYAAVAAAGAVLLGFGPTDPRRLAAALALAAPYARYRLRTAPLPATSRRRRVELLPATLAVDLAEVGACLVGSVRHRTFVL
jgi:glycosyltransferase involved in cell wall biosynthesis